MSSSGELQDAEGRVWARFYDVRESYGAIVAECELAGIPPDALAVFNKHERRVLNLELSFIDKLEEQIAGFDLYIVWQGESQRVKVYDVQMPQGGISFRLRPRSGAANSFQP